MKTKEDAKGKFSYFNEVLKSYVFNSDLFNKLFYFDCYFCG